jgi:hypothetical protein
MWRKSYDWYHDGPVGIRRDRSLESSPAMAEQFGLVKYDHLPNIYLVGGFEHFWFFHILGIIIPTDFFCFRGVETTNQI